MEIKTKYDIGQEVWCLEDLYYRGNGHAGKFAIPITLHSVTYSEDGLIYYCVGCGEYKEENLYPNKEACEQAIKEMESE